MFERYAKDALRAVVLAQEHARQLRTDRISDEHLLLGVIDAGAIGAKTLSALAGDLPDLRAGVLTVARPGVGSSRSGFRFSHKTRFTLRGASTEAVTLGHTWVDSGHLLLGLLLGEDRAVALRDMGDQDRCRATYLELLGQRSSVDPQPDLPQRRTSVVVVERNPEPSAGDLQRLYTQCEKLLGMASIEMQQGQWAQSLPGTEEEVKNTIRSLQDELRPLVDRPVNPVLVEGLALRLAGHLVTAFQQRADATDDMRIALLELDHGLLDPAMRAHLSTQPAHAAAEAANWIAEHTDWGEARAPSWLSDQERFDQFAAAAQHDPYTATEALLGWRRLGPIADKVEGVLATADSSAAVFGVLGAGGGWIAGSAAGAIAGGVIGVVVGVVVAILAANYRARPDD